MIVLELAVVSVIMLLMLPKVMFLKFRTLLDNVLGLVEHGLSEAVLTQRPRVSA